MTAAINPTVTPTPSHDGWLHLGALRLAQLGAALHIGGGLLDFSMKKLQHFHLEYLQVGVQMLRLGLPLGIIPLSIGLATSLGALGYAWKSPLCQDSCRIIEVL